MRHALLTIITAALPLGAQPKLLVNAQADTRSAAAGLEREFRVLVAAQPQPAWIGYSVPAVRGHNLGCDYVRDGVNGSGVVHLEPPDHAVILFRVESNAVDRIRTVSPDCEIDGGGVPVHWLSDVKPAESVALLATFIPQREHFGDGMLSAIAVHADPTADSVLEGFLKPDQPETLRERAVSWLVRTRGNRGIADAKNVIANDPIERVRERAVSALGSSKQQEAADLLVSIARDNTNARLRAQAISGLARRQGPAVIPTLTNAVENDPDPQVRRRAVAAMRNLPDGAGIPLLIQLVKTTKNAEVRKQAMNSLGQSRDPRAMAFFEEVLKR